MSDGLPTHGMPNEGAASDPTPMAGGDFTLLVTRLGVQALLALGRITNPLTGEARTDVAQARMIRADLAMLFEKTEGNLDALEHEHLQRVLSDLDRRIDEAEG